METSRLGGLPLTNLPGAEEAVRPATGDGTADAAYRARLADAAEKFEGFFISQMLRQMRSATRALADEDSPLRNRVNDDMLDLADTTVAEALAGQRAFGIADVILRQMLPPAPAPAELPPVAANMAGKFNSGRD